MFLAHEIESGYDSEHWIDYPDEVLTPEPIGSLANPDIYAHPPSLDLGTQNKTTADPGAISSSVE